MLGEENGVVVAASGLTKLFGHGTAAVRAVDNVSFAIGPGETLGLVGESGCGKSTVGRCVLRLLDPDGGTISFHGTAIQDLSPRQMRPFRQRLQMVFQDPLGSMNPSFTLRRTLLDALRHVDLVGDRRVRLGELLDAVGLPETMLERRPTEMSGGQLQRAGIARALASQPEFVFLDEPTSSLDLSVRGQIINLLADLQSERRLAYLFASHDLGVVARLATRMIVMYRGRVMETGPVDRIFGDAQHPYTGELLIGADLGVSPRPRAAAGAASSSRVAAAGAEGCRYASRCEYVHDRCREEPPLVRIGAGRESRCWLAEPGEG